MIAVFSFFASAVLLMTLLGLRWLEISRGARIWENWRNRMDEYTVRYATYVSRELPKLLASRFVQTIIHVSHYITARLLKTVQRIEHRLRVLHDLVKGKRHIEKQERPASEFLNGVVEYKRNGNGRKD